MGEGKREENLRDTSLRVISEVQEKHWWLRKGCSSENDMCLDSGIILMVELIDCDGFTQAFWSLEISVCVCVCVCTCTRTLCRVQLFATPWTVTFQAPLSMGFSRQGSWRRLPFPPPGDLYDPGTEPMSLISPAFGRQVLYHCTIREEGNTFPFPYISN